MKFFNIVVFLAVLGMTVWFLYGDGIRAVEGLISGQSVSDVILTTEINIQEWQKESDGHGCEQHPTLECVQNKIDEFGLENIRTGLPWQVYSPYEHQALLDEKFKLTKNNRSNGIDTKEINRYFKSEVEKARFFRLLTLKIIQNSEYGAPYPFWDGGSKTLTKFLNRSSFRSFESSRSFEQILDYWTATATHLEDDRNYHLLQIADIWLNLKNENKANSVLKKLHGQLGTRSPVAVNLFQSAREIGLNLQIEPSILPPLSRAEIFILQSKNDEAYRLLMNEKKQALAILEDAKYEVPPSRSLSQLKKIAIHLTQIEKKTDAKAIIDQVYALEKESIVHKSFIRFYEFSKLYRLAGAYEQAESLMRDYMQRSDNRTCASFNTPWYHAECAVELVYLGYTDVAYKKVFNACKNSNNCGPIVDMYHAALETNAKLPKLSKMLNSITEEDYTSILLQLSAFHFAIGDFNAGNALLEKSVIAMEKTGRSGSACKLGYVSIASDRKELLQPIFTIAIRSIFKSDISLETKMSALYKVHECFKRMIN